MRIVHSEHEHLVVFSDAEAEAVTDACTLIVAAARSISPTLLPVEMTAVLGELMQGLRSKSQACCDDDLT